MALIRATCNECGDVELRSRDLTIRVCVETDEGTYSFRCPICRMIEVRPADRQVIDILGAAGVTRVDWRLPAPSGRRDGACFTVDDLIDFHELLESDGWFDDLESLLTER